jgi:hypothetical protein
MSITSGTVIHAPKGFHELAAGATYFFLRSSPQTKVVTLLEFVERPAKVVVRQSKKDEGSEDGMRKKRMRRTVTRLPLPIPIHMPREAWESGLLRGMVVSGQAKTMPPWLDALEGLDLGEIDLQRTDAAKSHRDRVDDKLFSISQLVARAPEILDHESLDKVINAHARSLMPVQNETRVRLWFYVYLVFGRNRDALHYPIHRIGHWDRMAPEHEQDEKRGAPGRKGGYNTTAEMRQMILESYARHAGIGVSDEQVYTDALKKDFGCKSRMVSRGHVKQFELYHPDGKPFPSKGTYFYHVNKHFRPQLVRETRLGKKRAQSKFKPALGSFTESAWNLMQRVEADGYRVFDLPKGYIEGSDLPALVVVTIRDVASGKKVGIGFSQGSETAAAYRMAQFCAAIGLEAFGALLGLKLKDGAKGVSPHMVTDRGPGATAGGLPRDPEVLPVVRQLTPSYSGKSKAIVETSNPKTPSDDEAPSFRRSDLTTVALARREFGNLLAYNELTQVANRVDPELEHRVSRLSPSGVWAAMDSVGRNDAVQVSFEAAVRAYLDLVPAKLKDSYLEMVGRRYYSKFEVFMDALSAVKGGGHQIDVKVYVLTCCIRHVWFEWKGRLVQLDVRYPTPVSREVMDMSLEEAVEFDAHMRRRIKDHEEHKRGARIYFEQDFKEQIGDELVSGSRVAGRAKRGSAVARQEAKEAKYSAAGRKSA